MPDVTQGRVHRFRDHEVAGVNWRPTRFVDEVPDSRVCSLCRMIPKRILLLPCSHTLCEACHAANSQGVGGRCPLDKETFEEAECFGHDFPTRKANALKVHCWNEAHGCDFEGAAKDMLRHYEKECTFHAVECTRCGEEILHGNLSTHYVTECVTGAPPASAVNTSSRSRETILRGVGAALQEFKTLLTKANYEETLPAIQSCLNELLEKARNQESRMAEVYREVGGNAETAQNAARTTSTSKQEPASRRTPKTSIGTDKSTSSSSLSCPQNRSAPLKPVSFPNLPQDVMRNMRKTSTQDYPQHYVVNPNPRKYRCDLELITAPSTTRSWSEVRRSVKYRMKFDMFPSESSGLFAGDAQVAEITVLHTMDAYFTVKVSITDGDLVIKIDFYRRIMGSRHWSPSVVVNVETWNQDWKFSLPSAQEDSSDFMFDGEMWVSSPSVFAKNLHLIEVFAFFRNSVEFEIEVSHRKICSGGNSSVDN